MKMTCSYIVPHLIFKASSNQYFYELLNTVAKHVGINKIYLIGGGTDYRPLPLYLSQLTNLGQLRRVSVRSYASRGLKLKDSTQLVGPPRTQSSWGGGRHFDIPYGHRRSPMTGRRRLAHSSQTQQCKSW